MPPAQTSPAQIVIVGGGISGLSAAFFLAQRGVRPLLMEQNPTLGGLVGTDRTDRCELERGPDSFIATKPEMRELARELGIEHLIIPSNDQKRRVFLARQRAGRAALMPMPPGMVMMAPGDLAAALRSPVFSLPTKLRFLRERLARPRARSGDVSVADFVLDHFNQEVLEIITEPLLMGVYGGDARRLSMESVLPRFLDYERQLGSTIRGAQQEKSRRSANATLFQSFAGGMQTVIDALENRLRDSMDRITGQVSRIDRTANGWRVSTAERSFDAAQVIVAAPARIAAQLLTTTLPEVAALLAAIEYSSALLVTTLYDKNGFPHPLDGFGFLVPNRERETIAAGTWINSKFPPRVAANRIALRSFIVGAEANRLHNASDAELISLVKADLKLWMGIHIEPVRTIVTRWPHSMPQYTVGHNSRMHDLQRLLGKAPGLRLCGNAYIGVGLSDSIRSARHAVDTLVPITNA